MSDTHLAIAIFICFFVLAGCAMVVPSTRDLDTPLAKSDFGSYDPFSSPIATPYLDYLKTSHKNGAIIISDGSYALLHRAALARMAKYSIEIQTYIYENDVASRVLMHEIWLAANRGVKIKILVDDNGLDSDYSDVIALNNHPNIEVRIFNPYRNRIKLFRLPEMIFDYSRINRRMHNKLFIVDGVALIIGGRNIADNYFDNSLGVNFSDTDALFIGDIAQEALASFKEYWEYHRSIPVEFLPSKRKMKKFLEEYPKIIQDLESDSSEWDKYDNITNAFIKRHENKENTIYWGNAKLFADSPTKIDSKTPTSQITAHLADIWKEATDSVYISSAYLVPGKGGFAFCKEGIQRGVNIYMLTNSLSSTDVLPVYSGWERWRNKLVKAGVQVYEYKISQGKARIRDKTGSGASLHSKTLVFDNTITFIGSFNLDPRSSTLNSEVMAMFDNEDFAKENVKLIHADMQRAWHVEQIQGKITWSAQDDDGEIVSYTHSPDTSLWVRFVNKLTRIFPENQL